MGSKAGAILKPFKDAFRIIFRTIADDLVPIAARIGGRLAGVLGGVFSAISRSWIFRSIAAMTQALFSWVGSMAGLLMRFALTVFAPVITTIGTIASGLSSVLSGALTALAANPVVLIILAIVAVLILLYEAWQNNWFGIRDIVTEFWTNTLEPIVTQIWDWLAVNVPAALEVLQTWWLNAWDNVIAPAIQRMWPILGHLITFLAEVFVNFIPSYLETAKAAFWVFVKIVQVIAKVFELIWVGIKVLVFLAVSFLIEQWNKAKERWAETVETIGEWVESLKTWFKNLVDDFIEKWEEMLDEHPLLEEAWESLQDVVMTVVDAVKGYVDGWKAKFDEFLEGMEEWKTTFVQLWEGLQTWFQGIFKTFTGWLDDLIGRIQGVIDAWNSLLGMGSPESSAPPSGGGGGSSTSSSSGAFDDRGSGGGTVVNNNVVNNTTVNWTNNSNADRGTTSTDAEQVARILYGAV